ncbi:MAG: hypothetical protein GY755_06480 [Chloroflexi bacterium]|nr:hypothetical protein [Chloroflexota bacterium]
MRIIDKTPLINEDGSISFINRVKGTLEHGFSWYPDLQAQQKAINILDKQLGKNFTLIRNHALENSKIIIPIILIGPPGIQAIFVTHVNGSFRAKNDAWGTVSGGSFKEASINLLKRIHQLGKALDVYLKKKDFELSQGVEPILLSVNSALHVSSVRPIVRIILSDAVERFASSLAQEPPVMSVEDVHKIAEEIVNPRPPKAPEAQLREENMDGNDFAFDENASASPKPAPQKRRKAPAPAKKTSTDYFGMTGKQLAVIGVMGLMVICLLVLFILGILFFA